jgi:hypothetical protein
VVEMRKKLFAEIKLKFYVDELELAMDYDDFERKYEQLTANVLDMIDEAKRQGFTVEEVEL